MVYIEAVQAIAVGYLMISPLVKSIGWSSKIFSASSNLKTLSISSNQSLMTSVGLANKTGHFSSSFFNKFLGLPGPLKHRSRAFLDLTNSGPTQANTSVGTLSVSSQVK